MSKLPGQVLKIEVVVPVVVVGVAAEVLRKEGC
jgi:hypothetical protein